MKSKTSSDKHPPSRIPIPEGVYVTKYALTTGLLFFPRAGKVQFYSWNLEKDDWDLSDPDMVEVIVKRERDMGDGNMCFHGEGREWHRTLKEAQDRVSAMVEAKRKSLLKQLKKIDAALDRPAKTRE